MAVRLSVGYRADRAACMGPALLEVAYSPRACRIAKAATAFTVCTRFADLADSAGAQLGRLRCDGCHDAPARAIFVH